MIGLLYFIAAIAGAVLMLHFQIGPFGHPKFAHHSLRFMQINHQYRRSIVSCAWIILSISVSHLLGLWSY